MLCHLSPLVSYSHPVCADLLGGVALEEVDALVPLCHVVRVLPQHHRAQQRRTTQRQGLTHNINKGGTQGRQDVSAKDRV